jgi:putative membrane protein insertion efficiency factor
LLKQIFILPIKRYKKFISPLLGKHCKYYPTCSEYAVEAIEIHGVAKGLALAAFRILRCNPWAKGGYDPVPPLKQGKKLKKQ